MAPDPSPLDPLYDALASGRKPRGLCLIDWGTDLLVAGYDTPHLRRLAGLSLADDTEDVEACFDLVLKELALSAPDAVDDALALARAVARALLTGAVSPTVAVSRIHEVAVSPLDHPRSLQPWCDLDGGFVADANGRVTCLTGADLEEAIRAQARAFLDEDPHALSKRIRDQRQADAP
ncbi:MAG: hypothetical protein R3E10_19515 [Gemmatimonadota bacterium]